MKRVQFWQRNLSQVTTVMLSAAIEKDDKTEQLQIQSAYEDIIAKFNEVIHTFYQNSIRRRVFLLDLSSDSCAS